MRGIEVIPSPTDRIVVIVDADKDVRQINRLAKDLSPRAFKFGHSLLQYSRPTAVLSMLKTHGVRSWLDTSFNSLAGKIGEEVNGSIKQGFDLVTICPLNSPEAMAAAAKTTINHGKIAVKMPDYNRNLIPMFLERVLEANDSLSYHNQIDNVICEANDISTVTKYGNFTITATGIMLDTIDRGDHISVMTPKQALDAGADILAVGRAITRDLDDSVRVFGRIVEEIDNFVSH